VLPNLLARSRINCRNFLPEKSMRDVIQSGRLEQQIAFLIEADRLKNVLRRTLLTDASRRENTAEHSWHLALAAMVLAEYSPIAIDLPRVLRMLIVHDLVEIDAGDTFAYDKEGNATKKDRERRGADRIFGLLPAEIGNDLRVLWEEFEAQLTPNACFANAVDRVGPFLQNTATNGGTWRIYKLSREEVLARMDPVRTALPAMWPKVLGAIDLYYPAGDST
jgi:putative hydrolase of HD superfamily